MLLLLLIIMLLSNSVILRRDKSILHSKIRVLSLVFLILIIYYGLLFAYSDLTIILVNTSLLYLFVILLQYRLYLRFCIWIMSSYTVMPTRLSSSGTSFTAIFINTSLYCFTMVKCIIRKLISALSLYLTIGVRHNAFLSLMVEYCTTLIQYIINILHVFSTISHVVFRFLGVFPTSHTGLWIFLRISRSVPEVHTFANKPLQSSPPTNNSELNKLTYIKKRCKEELLEADSALKDLEKANRLDNILKDKSKNKSMRDIMDHYKEFFDEESGNTKKQGLLQVFQELTNDFNMKRNLYLKAKKKWEDFTTNPQYFLPVIFSSNYKSVFSIVSTIFPFTTLFLSMFWFVVSIVLAWDLNIVWLIPECIWDYKDYVLHFIKYEIVFTIYTCVSSVYFLYKKYKTYRHMFTKFSGFFIKKIYLSKQITKKNHFIYFFTSFYNNIGYYLMYIYTWRIFN